MGRTARGAQGVKTWERSRMVGQGVAHLAFISLDHHTPAMYPTPDLTLVPFAAEPPAEPHDAEPHDAQVVVANELPEPPPKPPPRAMRPWMTTWNEDKWFMPAGGPLGESFVKEVQEEANPHTYLPIGRPQERGL